VAAALRWFHLGHQSLWIDEVISWGYARVGGHLTFTHLTENVHGPLYAWILHAWSRVAGESEWALRAPSAVCGVALVPATAWLSARWLGRETLVPAAWLAAGSPYLI
jgi:predicted membrane-bound mannosyltransferase